jgi:hypothetical protein
MEIANFILNFAQIPLFYGEISCWPKNGHQTTQIFLCEVGWKCCDYKIWWHLLLQQKLYFAVKIPLASLFLWTIVTVFFKTYL